MNSMTKTILMSSMLLAVSATQCAEQQPQAMRIITPAEVAQAIAAIDARAPKASVEVLKPGFFSQLKPIARNVLLNSAAATNKSRLVKRSLEDLEQEEASLHAELHLTIKIDKKAVKKQAKAHQNILNKLQADQVTERGRVDIALHGLAQNPNLQNPTLVTNARRLLQEQHEQALDIEKQRQAEKRQELLEAQKERKGPLGEHIQQIANQQKPLRQQKEQLDQEYADSYAAICNNVKRQRRS